jgi:hypothetical protein
MKLCQSQCHITADSQSASPSWTRDQFFFLLEIFFRQLRVCYFVALSDERTGLSNYGTHRVEGKAGLVSSLNAEDKISRS